MYLLCTGDVTLYEEVAVMGQHLIAQLCTVVEAFLCNCKVFIFKRSINLFWPQTPYVIGSDTVI